MKSKKNTQITKTSYLKNISDEKNNKEVIYLNKKNTPKNKDFSLDKLSTNLTLSAERSKALRSLYERNNTLKKKSSKLIKALNEEKYISQLQSEFVSLVSHEFRTPLSIIKATSDVIKRVYINNKNDNQEQLLQQIHKIDNAILRMNKLIDSTLTLSRLELGKIEFNPTSFCLKELVLEIVERYQDISSKVKFSINIDTKGILLNGDKNLIDQIFTNLISNAIKYSNNSPHITITCSVDNNQFTISVEDDGIGMSKEDLKKLFIKYFRSKNTIGTSGTGIGLYLVKQFITLHHGTITAESELDKGSKFTFYLPT